MINIIDKITKSKKQFTTNIILKKPFFSTNRSIINKIKEKEQFKSDVVI